MDDDPRRAYDAARRRAEQRLRKHLAEAKPRAAPLSPGNREALERFQSRLDQIDALVDGVAERAEQAADAEGSPAPGVASAALALDALSVSALHKLDAASSELRHSIAQAALGGLRMLAQQLPEQHADPAFPPKLAAGFERLDTAGGQVAAYFAYPVARGVTPRELFPEAESAASAALRDLADCATPLAWQLGSAEWARSFATRVVEDVDAVLAVFAQLKERIGAQRVSLVEVARQTLAPHADAAAAQDIALDTAVHLDEDEDDEAACRIFADAEALRNAFGELVRNAIRHAFPPEHAGARRIDLVVRALLDEDAASLTVADTGRGMDRATVHRLGTGYSTAGGGYGVGMVRRVVETEHLGRLHTESVPGQGTRIEARFPLHLPLERPEET